MEIDAITISEIVCRQRQFFETGQTRSLKFRWQQLQVLKQAILSEESAILDALQADLHKPVQEAYVLEIACCVLSEIDYALKHLRSWVKPQRVRVPWAQFPASAQVYRDPLGVVLIISPWNYPFMLAMSPLIGAIAAGNCVMIKPSELATHTSRALATIIAQHFAPEYITVLEGGVEISQQLLAQPVDHILFTGSTEVGKRVMAAAAQTLTPVTLELGGKCPCIVDIHTNLACTAKRIAWGKFLNAGQSCVAPDYVLVDRRIQTELIASLQTAIREFYGENPADSPDYGRIINPRQFERLIGYLQGGQILMGGQFNAETLYIAPTLLGQVAIDTPLMQTEIFGPILPIIPYADWDEAIAHVKQFPPPLALYLFSTHPPHQDQVLQTTKAGAICLNDTLLHLGVPELPFGGVGASGMGRYHGRAGFETFTSQKSVLQRSFQLDLSLRYPPYRNSKLEMLKRLLRLG
jgi:acyl-CoA reductase-like NAD-dependent aldehyde dehydrogenase